MPPVADGHDVPSLMGLGNATHDRRHPINDVDKTLTTSWRPVVGGRQPEFVPGPSIGGFQLAFGQLGVGDALPFAVLLLPDIRVFQPFVRYDACADESVGRFVCAFQVGGYPDSVFR